MRANATKQRKRRSAEAAGHRARLDEIRTQSKALRSDSSGIGLQQFAFVVESHRKAAMSSYERLRGEAQQTSEMIASIDTEAMQ